MNLTKSNVVLAVLAVGLAVPTFLQLQKDRATFVDVARVPLLFDGFTADNCGLITLRQPKAEQPTAEPPPGQQKQIAYDEIVFARTDNGWVFAKGDLKLAPVSKERVEADVLTHLRTIRFDRESLVVADASPEQLERYGLDPAHAFVVEARGGDRGQNVVADLLVGIDAGKGQTGTDAVRGVFVRKSDSNDVILYETERGWTRSVQTELWLDKVLAKLQVDKIMRFSLQNAATGRTVAFTRSEGKASWTAVETPPGLGAVRQGEVEALLQRLRWISAQDFRVPLQDANLPQLGLQPPQLRIEILVREGDRDRKIELAVGNKLDDKAEYYLTCNESKFLMTWPAGSVVPFEVDAKTLFDPAAPVDPGKPAEPKPGDEKRDEKKDDEKKPGE